MKNCEACGSEFKAKNKSSRFCSRTCSSSVRKRDRVCVQCGKHFWPRSSETRGEKAQKYCSVECRGIVRRKFRICEWCGKEFWRTTNSQPKYCSPQCFTLARYKGVNKNLYKCARCGVDVERYPSTVRNPDRVYCSGKCRSENRVYKKGADHPQYKGGWRYVGKDGYVKLGQGTVRILEHRKVMEEAIGRPLFDHETVHHINGNRADNRIENLQLWSGKHGAGVRHQCMDCGSHNIESVPI